jgi:hypothetical protein|eukprot:COSAG01_NODE_1220_length_11162_cov_107.350176_3_plen_113_part_00
MINPAIQLQHAPMPMQMQQLSTPVYAAQMAPQMLPQMQQMSPPMQQVPQCAGASLDELLTVAALDAFREPIKAMGVATIDDFQDVADEDLIGCGLKIVQVKRLRRKLLEMTV